MQVNEAINLIRSGDDLSFAQIKEAHEALAGRFSDTKEFTLLTVIANKKIQQIDTSLFGMSLDEAIAAAEVVKTFTPKKQRNTEDFEKFLGKIEDRVAELKAEEQSAAEQPNEAQNEAPAEVPTEAPAAAEDDLPSLEVINRNYESISKVVDKINPLDENDSYFAESRNGLEMIDARDENNQPADINPLVEQARIKTMADLLTSTETVSEETFRKHFKNNIDANTFKVLSADKAAEFIKNGDTKGMAAAFSSMVNDFTAGGKKSKRRVDYNTAIALINTGNAEINRFTNKLEKKFGSIPAVKDLRARLNKLDTKLTKKYGKAYTTSRDIVKGISGIATDLALVGLAGATGPIGLGIYSVYTFNRNVSPYLQAYGKAHNKTGIGFMEFARQNKRDASLAGLYTVSSMLTGLSAAGLAYHNVANQLGSNNIDALTRYISHSKMGVGFASVMAKQGVDVVNAVKHGKNVKEAVGKFALAAGIFAVAAGGREMYNLEHNNGDLAHGGNGVDTTPATGTGIGNIIINGDNNEVNILNDHSVDNSTNIDNSTNTNTTIIDNCCDPCQDCQPVEEVNDTIKPEPRPEPEPVKPEPVKHEPVKVEPVKPEPVKTTPTIKLEPLEGSIHGVDAPEAARPDLSDTSGLHQAPLGKIIEPTIPEVTDYTPYKVPYNGVAHYDSATEALHNHAANGIVNEDGTYFDLNKSNSHDLDKLNAELQAYSEQIKECQPDSDKPLNVQSSTKDGVKEFDNVKQLIKQTQSKGR